MNAASLIITPVEHTIEILLSRKFYSHFNN